MKKINILLLMLFVFSIKIYSQVGINTATPNTKTLLDISQQNKSTDPVQSKGILIPRLTETQRDAINPSSTENSLMIFNTTENCYNFWNNDEGEWKSLCGQLGKSEFHYDCNADVTVYGNYIKGKELTSSNYLSIKVVVTKPGSYEIKGITSNGFNFFATGTFIATGTFTVNVPGTGTPINEANGCQNCGTVVNMYGNNNNQPCSPPVQVTVIPNSGTYTMNCSTATVNGVYKAGTALSAANTITLPVVVTAIGSYSITTNTVNGISFSGSGNFTSTGNQNVTLYGTGTPTSTADTNLTITSNSQGNVVTTCNVNVVIVISKKTILHIGNETIYGYSAYTGPSRKLMDSQTNFGTGSSSIVKAEGYTHISLNTNPSDASLLAALNNKPDIVIIGFDNSSLNSTQSGYLLNYLNNKGVVIAFQDRADANVSTNFLRTVFNDAALTTSLGAGAGSVYPLTNNNNPVLNGPFGDIRGKNWGEDASSTVRITSAVSGITPLSYAQPINNSTVYDGITGFLHNNLNLVWFGDGGFLSNENANGNEYTSQTIEPFVAPSSGGYFPLQKSSYGYGGNGLTAGTMQVQNSIVFANILAWAINQANTNGINSH